MQHLTNFIMLFFHFHSVKNILKFPLRILFWPMDYLEVLFNFHVLVAFSVISLVLILSLILLWSENIFSIISILLNIIRFVLWSRTYLSESSMYTGKDCVVGWNVLLMSITFNWSMALFSSYLSLLSSCLLVLLLLREECQIL